MKDVLKPALSGRRFEESMRTQDVLARAGKAASPSLEAAADRLRAVLDRGTL